MVDRDGKVGQPAPAVLGRRIGVDAFGAPSVREKPADDHELPPDRRQGERHDRHIEHDDELRDALQREPKDAALAH